MKGHKRGKNGKKGAESQQKDQPCRMGKGCQRRTAVAHHNFPQHHTHQKTGGTTDGTGKKGEGRQKHQKKGLEEPAGQENVVGQRKGRVGKIDGVTENRQIVGKPQSRREKGSEKKEKSKEEPKLNFCFHAFITDFTVCEKEQGYDGWMKEQYYSITLRKRNQPYDKN